ncbi:helix-turn-helix transcriptional regulator [Halodesulfovibrio sp. MK-HDV]|jgi:transcriptional regulator with XRE-family HTH domain|uniref:helix-turn-helix domain-containing protein n=1 Tax=Halodesulfovibrio sp. MK-HDV TaxID=2599925 RepID=UPI001369DC24|nr:helix-turn-helix transcriptional regulator [Halodesulfovibrio sp. MK-HDV]
MTNVIEQLRQEKGLTFAALGRECGLTKTAVLRHCKGERNIGAEAALRYHVKLGIPLQNLRPDLY